MLTFAHLLQSRNFSEVPQNKQVDGIQSCSSKTREEISDDRGPPYEREQKHRLKEHP
jgi:hypothetical protein